MGRKKLGQAQSRPVFVDYDFEDRTYQIDTEHRKVYRRFVEIETSKACEILSSWRAQHAGA